MVSLGTDFVDAIRVVVAINGEGVKVLVVLATKDASAVEFKKLGYVHFDKYIRSMHTRLFV